MLTDYQVAGVSLQTKLDL